jgi:outer membrane protein TolC
MNVHCRRPPVAAVLVALAAALAGVAPARAAAPEPLSLEEAARIAEQRSAKLTAQSKAIQAAGEMEARAGALPDPKLRFGIDNLPITGPDAWRYDRDFMTMRRIGLMQEIVNGAKRRARTERAASERQVEQAMLAIERSNVRREAAIAWYETFHALRSLEVLQELVQVETLQQETVSAAVAGGRANAAEGFAVRSALEQARDAVLEQERVVARARLQLAQFVGEVADRPLASPPDTGKLTRSAEAMLASLERHPTLAVYDARESLARSEVALARSTKRPDWSVELLYGQREPYFSNMITLMFSVELPVLTKNRQDRDIAAQLAQLEKLDAQREDARRSYLTMVRSELVDWETWQRRVERYEAVLIPLAVERAKVTTAAYRGGRGDLASVLAARKAEAEARLGRHAALLERGRAWVTLNFLAHAEDER